MFPGKDVACAVGRAREAKERVVVAAMHVCARVVVVVVCACVQWCRWCVCVWWWGNRCSQTHWTSPCEQTLPCTHTPPRARHRACACVQQGFTTRHLPRCPPQLAQRISIRFIPNVVSTCAHVVWVRWAVAGKGDGREGGRGAPAINPGAHFCMAMWAHHTQAC